MTEYMRRCAAILSLAILLAAGACKTTEMPLAGPAIDGLTGKHDATEERLSTAAAVAAAEGKTEEALALYERLYTHPTAAVFTSAHYRDGDVVLNYAQLLRKTGRARRAVEVLSPLVETRPGSVKNDADPILLNEFAAGNIETGNFGKAEAVLNRVLGDEKARKFHADAHNLLGISLDAQGRHKEAERSFRRALGGWKGDSTSVLNNLAVCLAGQGMFDESIMTLRQALIMSPDKQEVARNIQLVSELRTSFVPQPKAVKKEKARESRPADKGRPQDDDK